MRDEPQKGIPVIAICGSLADDLPSLPFENIVGAFSITKHPDSLEQLLKDARENLLFTARNIGNLLGIEKKRLNRFKLKIKSSEKLSLGEYGHQRTFQSSMTNY